MRALGCKLNSVFMQAAMGVAGYENIRGNAMCGATGDKPKPPPASDGPSCSAAPPRCGSGFFSFEPGAEVLTKDGPKKIEDVKIGDLIASRDAFIAETTWRPVTDLFRRIAPGIVRSVEAEDGSRETYGVTSEHPFFKQGKGFTPVRELAVGDVVLAEGGARLKIAAIETIERPITDYNLEVAQRAGLGNSDSSMSGFSA